MNLSLNINTLKNIVAPPHCMCCDNPMAIDSILKICDKCANEMPFNAKNTCLKCGKPVGDFCDICNYCKHQKLYFKKNIAPLRYKKGVKEAIRKMKFVKDQAWIAHDLGGFLADFTAYHYRNIDFDAIIYVPLSLKHYFKRGFNQAYEIALPVSLKMKLPIIERTLTKIKDTKAQSSLGMKERYENIKDAYGIANPEKIRGKRLLLIDDVFTSGATMNECAKTLMEAGAMEIYTAAVAVAGRG